MFDRTPRHGLDAQGIATDAMLHWNLIAPPLVEHAVRRGEGRLAKHGPLVVETGKHTGRSAKDKFIVRDAETEASVWWGKTNKGMTPEHFAALKADFLAELATRDELFVQDLYGGSQPEHRVQRARDQRARVAQPVHPHDAGASRGGSAARFRPRIYDRRLAELPRRSHTPRHAERNGDRGQLHREANPDRRHRYAGEMKKSVFGLLNYLLPLDGIMPMHCSANIGPQGDTAVFFGLSGTGKTTLSADASRTLIGDDEHGWSDTAVFNFEGGCYAKMIRLSPEAEPEIFATTKRFGTVLENVVMDPETRELDFNDNRLAENSRGSYPIDFIPNARVRRTSAPCRATSSSSPPTPMACSRRSPSSPPSRRCTISSRAIPRASRAPRSA